MRRVAKSTLGAAALFGLVLAPAVGAAINRGLLWRVVQTCVANKKITGAAFPCLDVNISNGVERGYAVLRAPLDKTQVVVMPTARIEGIENPKPFQPTAPNFFAAAWSARHFVAESAPHPLEWDDIGLGVNSQYVRSQDQLHIHVECVAADVKAMLRTHERDIKTDAWQPLRFLLRRQRYSALKLKTDDLSGINPFSLVATGLSIAPADLQGVTIVVLGAVLDDGTKGFYVLANLTPPTQYPATEGEDLLDHACR